MVEVENGQLVLGGGMVEGLAIPLKDPFDLTELMFRRAMALNRRQVTVRLARDI